MSTTLSTPRPRRPKSPLQWWRTVCDVTPEFAASGDLPFSREAALEQLRQWEDAGITDVIDVRGEANDSDFIRQNSDTVTPHWHGVDDNGGERSDTWFESLIDTATEILREPGRKILVHCHMGVNRGPSALYALLLTQGYGHLEALRLIRNARPIAGLIYAPDAVRWFGRRENLDPETIDQMHADVTSWLRRNDLDIPYVIHCIGNRLAV